MNVFTQIRQMVRDGQAYEARELFFKEAAPWFQELHEVVNSLLQREGSTPDMEAFWERLRTQWEE